MNNHNLKYFNELYIKKVKRSFSMDKVTRDVYEELLTTVALQPDQRNAICEAYKQITQTSECPGFTGPTHQKIPKIPLRPLFSGKQKRMLNPLISERHPFLR